MTKNEKAVARLDSIGISAKIENSTVYVCIQDTELELSEFEINYQASCFDEEKADEEEED